MRRGHFQGLGSRLCILKAPRQFVPPAPKIAAGDTSRDGFFFHPGYAPFFFFFFSGSWKKGEQAWNSSFPSGIGRFPIFLIYPVGIQFKSGFTRSNFKFPQQPPLLGHNFPQYQNIPSPPWPPSEI